MEYKVSISLLIILIINVSISIDSYKLILNNNNNNNNKRMTKINNNVLSKSSSSELNQEILLKDFYMNNNNIISLNTNINNLPLSNITTTEWSIYTEINNLFEDKLIDNIMLNLIKQNENDKKLKNIIKIDKGTSNSIDILNELYELKGNYEYHLNIFRRNIALRANRVLHPANNAQTFSTLINLMISKNEWLFSAQVCEYIGLTPDTYCKFDSQTNTYNIDINSISNYVTRFLLELRIEIIADKANDKILEATNSEKLRRDRESVQEWFYTQIHRSDLNFRVADCILAVCRLSLRYAVSKSIEDPNIKIIVDMNKIDKVLLLAGIPLDNTFLRRIQLALQADIDKLLNKSFENLVIIPKIIFNI